MSQAFTLEQIKSGLAANNDGKHSLVVKASEIAVVVGIHSKTLKRHCLDGKMRHIRVNPESKRGPGFSFEINQELVDDLNGLHDVHERVA